MNTIGIYISVPLACFRVPRAREYFETYPLPPPSTVYGMLLSMVGEIDRRKHEGAEIAIAALGEPAYSVVLRTLWRVKNKNVGLGQNENRRPDFQEILSDVNLAIWIRQGMEESNNPPLVERVRLALDNPSAISRFGGLSLGESSHLVNEVSYLKSEPRKGNVLVSSEDGDLSLPVWPDHVGSNTNWGQYRLVSVDMKNELPQEAWITIRRPKLI
jgi:CRISPR-associated protein Cas5t